MSRHFNIRSETLHRNFSSHKSRQAIWDFFCNNQGHRRQRSGTSFWPVFGSKRHEKGEDFASPLSFYKYTAFAPNAQTPFNLS